MSCVTCHLPPVTNANSYNKRPSPANFPIIGSKGRSRSKNLKTVYVTRHETTKVVGLKANFRKKTSLTKSLQDTKKLVFHDGKHTHRHTDRHGNSMTDPAQSLESVKILMIETTISFLVEGLAVWRMSRNQFEPVWAEIVKIYSAQKLELLIPQNRYIGHQGGTWKLKGTPIFV